MSAFPAVTGTSAIPAPLKPSYSQPIHTNPPSSPPKRIKTADSLHFGNLGDPHPARKPKAPGLLGKVGRSIQLALALASAGIGVSAQAGQAAHSAPPATAHVLEMSAASDREPTGDPIWQQNGNNYNARLQPGGSIVVREGVDIVMRDGQPVTFPAEVVRATAPASAKVSYRTVIDNQVYIGHGSGVFIRDAQGDFHVLTNRHVIDGHGGRLLEVTVEPFGSGEALTAEVIATDWRWDLALLNITNPQDFEPTAYIDGSEIRDLETNPLQDGEPILMVGNPGSQEDQFLPGFAHFLHDRKKAEYLARCLPGSSGSPVFDADGTLIGLNYAQFLNPKGVPQGHCQGIPANGIVAWLQSEGIEMEASASPA